MIQWPRAVYLHVPFCLHHCGYCDFTLVARRDHLIPQWFDCLQRELEQQRRESGARLPVDSIFIGGGHTDTFECAAAAATGGIDCRAF
jgi:oxygen-independent coproporphyrinogen-3 oxidase